MAVLKVAAVFVFAAVAAANALPADQGKTKWLQIIIIVSFTIMSSV